MIRIVPWSRLSLVVVFFLLLDQSGIASGFPGEQNKSISDQDLREIPPDAARIIPYAERIVKNPQGYWESTVPSGIEMVFIPAGEFLMGSPRQEYGREPGEGPVHRVYIQSLWIGKFEVTRKLWRAVMGESPPPSETPDLPQGDVSYNDIQKFLRTIRQKTGLRFRLPTEAEWEKCGRGGSRGPTGEPLDEVAWHLGNAGGLAHPVGTKRPNGYGLYDLLGNLWEWCSDWAGENYYSVSPFANPPGPAKGKRRIMRGGGFHRSGNYLRIAHRNDQDPSVRKPPYGFRLVLESIPTMEAQRTPRPSGTVR
jgi:formylglycine-generating enzyme required for sulfatase activity